MLVNRAITEVVRFAAPDVLMGVAYDPEELEPEVAAEPVDLVDTEVVDEEVDE